MNKIQELRHATGLSQSKFAGLFNIPVNTLQNWERNKAQPADYVVDLIEKVLIYEKRIKK